MSGQVSRGSADEYQADEQAGVTGLRSSPNATLVSAIMALFVLRTWPETLVPAINLLALS